MMQKLKEFFFPCEKVIKRVLADHNKAVKQNKKAHKKFICACNKKEYYPHKIVAHL